MTLAKQSPKNQGVSDSRSCVFWVQWRNEKKMWKMIIISCSSAVCECLLYVWCSSECEEDGDGGVEMKGSVCVCVCVLKVRWCMAGKSAQLHYHTPLVIFFFCEELKCQVIFSEMVPFPASVGPRTNTQKYMKRCLSLRVSELCGFIDPQVDVCPFICVTMKPSEVGETDTRLLITVC